jgi:hypothetical protein
MQPPLSFHPLANKFPLLNGGEFNEFVADIEAQGLREPITLYEGQVLEGRNRYRACLRLKREPRFKEFKGDAAAACAFVISQNIVRRHLKTKEKREAIAALLKANPEKSDRQIAKTVKSSHHTVEVVRTKLESTGQIAQLKKTVGADGKARSRPTPPSSEKKPRRWQELKKKARDIRQQAEQTLLRVWDDASPNERIKFVQARNVEITYAQQQILKSEAWTGRGPSLAVIKSIADRAEAASQAKQPNDDGLDIPAPLRHSPCSETTS